jgi:hypothetical protein
MVVSFEYDKSVFLNCPFDQAYKPLFEAIVDLDSATKLPRFNMPLELGVFLGARHFGHGRQKEKRCLILDRERYRYRAFISDLSGQDIREHRDEPARAIRLVRDWLRSQSPDPVPGGRIIADRYEAFRAQLPELCREAQLDVNDLIWVEYNDLVWMWLGLNT